MVGRLQRVPLREVWKDEARDFTPWLQQNIEVLNEVLSVNLANAEREQSAGSFSVDLVAEDEIGNTVVIENQLERSNHDHLGKLITYLTAVGAKTAIWIVSDPRPEHISAIGWLNESSAAQFYLVKVEAICIEDSAPAPLLTLIVGPSEESRSAAETKKGLAERHIKRLSFWKGLLERSKKRTTTHANVSPSKDNWIQAGAGRSGFYFIYSILMDKADVGLYIDTGDEVKNREYLDILLQEKTYIEDVFGSELVWDTMDNRRATRIRRNLESGGLSDESNWPAVQDSMVDAMVRLSTALKSRVLDLPRT